MSTQLSRRNPFIAPSTLAPIPDPLAIMFGRPFAFPDIPDFKVDVKETDDAYELTADFPGASKGDVDIKMENDILTISYDHTQEDGEKNDDGRWITHERSRSSMSRSFTFPNADEDATTANLEDGVLIVKIPKKEESETSKKIEIS